MRTIKQKGEKDCGVACVAMLAGVSYQEAASLVYPTGKVCLTKTKKLSEALRALGRKTLSDRRRPMGSKSLCDLSRNALVFVELKNGKNSKHWIVWDAAAKKVRDPYPTLHDFYIRGYLLVD